MFQQITTSPRDKNEITKKKDKRVSATVIHKNLVSVSVCVVPYGGRKAVNRADPGSIMILHNSQRTAEYSTYKPPEDL